MPLPIAFGDRLASILLRDCASLGIQPAAIQATPPSNSKPKKSKKSSRSRDSTTPIATTTTTLDTEVSLRSSADLLTRTKLALAKARALHRNVGSPPPSTVFKFPDLPPEIRLMIYEYIFLIYNKRKRSNSRPTFLDVLKANTRLYAEAYKVFCATNDFPIPLSRKVRSEERMSKCVEGLQEEDMKLVKRVLIAVPKDIQLTTPYHSIIIKHAKILELTLSVSTPNSLRVVAYSVIPSFAHIHTLTVILRNAHQMPSQPTVNRVAHMNSFRDVLLLIDKVVGVGGVRIHDSSASKGKQKGGKQGKGPRAKTRQIWRWEAEQVGEEKGERTFEMNVLKKHVKFD